MGNLFAALAFVCALALLGAGAGMAYDDATGQNKTVAEKAQSFVKPIKASYTYGDLGIRLSCKPNRC